MFHLTAISVRGFACTNNVSNQDTPAGDCFIIHWPWIQLVLHDWPRITLPLFGCWCPSLHHHIRQRAFPNRWFGLINYKCAKIVFFFSPVHFWPSSRWIHLHPIGKPPQWLSIVSFVATDQRPIGVGKTYKVIVGKCSNKKSTFGVCRGSGGKANIEVFGQVYPYISGKRMNYKWVFAPIEVSLLWGLNGHLKEFLLILTIFQQVQ